MTNYSYVGFRVEVTNKFIVRNFVKRFNSGQTAQAFDLHREGKITIEKVENMLVAHGEKPERGSTGLANFAIMIKMDDRDEIDRIVQIINVLGNDRLIRERVLSFVNGKSVLNDIPQLAPIKDGFIKIERLAPGFIQAGWYYAPEAIFDADD